MSNLIFAFDKDGIAKNPVKVLNFSDSGVYPGSEEDLSGSLKWGCIVASSFQEAKELLEQYVWEE